MKKILYIGNNKDTEYEEVTALLDLGYKVFSLGHQLDIRPDDPQYIRELIDPTLINLFREYHPKYSAGKLIGLHHKVVAEFDIFIVSDFLEHLTLNWKNISKKKVIWIWRKPSNVLRRFQPVIANYAAKGLVEIENPGGRTKYSVPISKSKLQQTLERIYS